MRTSLISDFMLTGSDGPAATITGARQDLLNALKKFEGKREIAKKAGLDARQESEMAKVANSSARMGGQDHPLVAVARARQEIERNRLLVHLRGATEAQDYLFKQKIAINSRIGASLERQFKAQERVAGVLAQQARIQMQNEAKSKNMDAMMAAKLAGPKATMQFVWKQMTLQAASERIMVWKSNVKAAHDPKVRRLLMLGKVARTRKQRLVAESVQDGFHNMYANRWDHEFFLLRQDHLYRGGDDDYNPDDSGNDNIFTRSKLRKSSVRELLTDEAGERTLASFKPSMAMARRPSMPTVGEHI